MRCSSHYPTRWPTSLLPSGHVPTAPLQVEATAAAGADPGRRLTVGTSAARPARDCRRSDCRADVMQVRPPSVVSGTAGSSPFGQSPFGDPGWL